MAALNLMRCKRCERMYDEQSPGECRYHAGRYVGAGQYALVPHWTCCGAAEQLGGCRLALCHAPCEATRLAIQSFCESAAVGPARSINGLDSSMSDVLSDYSKHPHAGESARPTIVLQMPGGDLSTAVRACSSASLSSLRHEDAPVVINASSEGNSTEAELHNEPVDTSTAPAPPGELIEGRYVVMPTDTFSGIALKHGMTVEALATANSMTSSNRCVVPGQVLRVMRPRLSDEDEEARRRKELIARFRRTQRCTMDEAKYYLDTNEYDFDLAVTERTGDVEWEREHHQAQRRHTEEGELAAAEASILVDALARTVPRGSAKRGSWPSWLRPWEDPIIRRCVLGIN
mmetsp:Transcript_7761/g.19815  ORF Transcript_7761/g.19815 Transcript_7761/m.19815 type:complete len:346 (-) Transcript_7761:381-1418(-)